MRSEIEEKFAVFELAYKFADAANRKDGRMFQTLWADDGAEWIIGKPINMKFEGKKEMGANLVNMLDRWQFFVQMITGGVVILNDNGKEAYARFYVQEMANSKDGSGNKNLSMYEDILIKKDGLWFFKTRTYHTIFQSVQPQIGDVLDVPELPQWCRDQSLNIRR